MARAAAAQPDLTLDRYQVLTNFPLCYFNGVENPNDTVLSCDQCLMQWEREMIARALDDAGNLIALHAGHYFVPRFLTDTDHEWTDPVLLEWGHVIGGGIQGLTDVTADVSASDFTTDPATITIPTASFEDEDEIYIIETSTGLEIIPDKVTESGANYEIEIDQCKLIEWDDLEGQALCIDYDGTFPATTYLKLADLTIYREYLDDSDQATITYGPACNCWYAGAACAGTDYTACVYVINEEISKVRVSLADYDAGDGTWTCNFASNCGCYAEDKVQVHYRAGAPAPGWETAVMRLAHTFLDFEPCGCAPFDYMLKRDRHEPSVLTVERINCPFGTMDGAWSAWQWLMNTKHGHAFML